MLRQLCKRVYSCHLLNLNTLIAIKSGKRFHNKDAFYDQTDGLLFTLNPLFLEGRLTFYIKILTTSILRSQHLFTKEGK